MSRLTKNGKYGNYEPIKHSNLYPAIDKLGQLEDIEQELGIDLITLFKALKNGVYFENDKKHHIVALDLGCSGNYRLSYEIVDGLFESVYTEDYGKTWALNKEELLWELVLIGVC